MMKAVPSATWPPICWSRPWDTRAACWEADPKDSAGARPEIGRDASGAAISAGGNDCPEAVRIQGSARIAQRGGGAPQISPLRPGSGQGSWRRSRPASHEASPSTLVAETGATCILALSVGPIDTSLEPEPDGERRDPDPGRPTAPAAAQHRWGWPDGGGPGRSWGGLIRPGSSPC